MPPKPDPTLHTLIHFLDRFTYKNAKSNPNMTRGSSIMQPLASTNAQDVLIKDRGTGLTEMPLNSESFWSKPSDKVDVDQVFFHQYFNRTESKKSKKSKKTQKAAATVDDSSEDEQEVWNALVQSNAELQDDGDDDDLGLEDFDSESDGFNDSDAPEAQESSAVRAKEQGDDFDDDESDDDELLLESEDSSNKDGEDVTPSDHPRTSNSRAKKRKDIKSLPTFASADDYADLLAEEEEEY